MKQEFDSTEFKDQGNKLYALHKYEDAIACYTRAIVSLVNLLLVNLLLVNPLLVNLLLVNLLLVNLLLVS